MVTTLIGIKKNMTSTYDARGRRVGATVLEVLPNLVTQVKHKEDKDGYEAVQLGYGTRKSVKKPQLGHLKKAGIEQKVNFLREVALKGSDVNPGEEIPVNKVFAKGDEVKVTGTSKGRGFQGGVKRYNFRGGKRTHGQSDRMRAPGSIGSGTTPGRVLKGKRMAGHMGNDQVSVKGLEVIAVDKTNGLLTVKGGIPGPAGSLVMITKLGKIKGYTPPPEEKEEEEEVKVEEQTNETPVEQVAEAPSEQQEAPVEAEGEQNA